MAEHYSVFLVAWLFILLIGGWLLINALIDLGARRVREWIVGRGLIPGGRWWRRAKAPDRRDPSSHIPIP